MFDEAEGTCVREEQASEFAKKCEKSTEKGNQVFHVALLALLMLGPRMVVASR